MDTQVFYVSGYELWGKLVLNHGFLRKLTSNDGLHRATAYIERRLTSSDSLHRATAYIEQQLARVNDRHQDIYTLCYGSMIGITVILYV